MLPPGAKVQDLALVWLPKGCGPNVRMNMEPDPAQSNRGRLVLYGNPLSQGIESGDGVTTQAGLVLQVPPRIVDTQVQLMPRGDWRPQPLGGLWIPLAYVGLGSLAILLVYGAVAMGLRAEGSNWIRARISGRD
jgi:hypothetical protein